MSCQPSRSVFASVVRRTLPVGLVASLVTPWLAAPAQATASTPAAEQVAALRWLEGRWLGSGGQFAAFYEEYRFLNDTTIEQREIADSSFARVSSRSQITVRDGQVVKLNAEGRTTTTIRVAGDTAFFTAGARSYRWIRTGPTEWTADLGRAVYTMRRLSR